MGRPDQAQPDAPDMWSMPLAIREGAVECEDCGATVVGTDKLTLDELRASVRYHFRASHSGRGDAV